MKAAAKNTSLLLFNPVRYLDNILLSSIYKKEGRTWGGRKKRRKHRVMRVMRDNRLLMAKTNDSDVYLVNGKSKAAEKWWRKERKKNGGYNDNINMKWRRLAAKSAAHKYPSMKAIRLSLSQIISSSTAAAWQREKWEKYRQEKNMACHGMAGKGRHLRKGMAWKVTEEMMVGHDSNEEDDLLRPLPCLQARVSPVSVF